MKKIYKILLGSLMSVLLLFAPVLSVSAAQDDTNTFRFSCATPAVSSTQGYIELCLQDANGNLSGRVIAWNVSYDVAHSVDEHQQPDTLPIEIYIYPNKIQFQNGIYLQDINSEFTNLDFTYFSMSSGYNVNTYYTGCIDLADSSATATITISDSYTVVGYHVYGNFEVRSSSVTTNTLFYTIYNEEVVQYNQLLKIINLINTLAADNDTIISQLNTIIANTDTIESKLSSCITLLTSIDTDLDAIKSQLAAIQSSQNQNAQDIQDNADKNASEIQKNQDANTDKALNGDSDIDSSKDTDKIDGAVGDMDSATDEALGGKSDEEIQAEVEESLDPDNLDIDYHKAQRISTFFDNCLTAFGNDYKTLLLLSLSLGLGAFLIGRRYG